MADCEGGRDEIVSLDEIDIETLLTDFADDNFYATDSSSSSDSEFECATDNSAGEIAIQPVVPEPAKKSGLFLFAAKNCAVSVDFGAMSRSNIRVSTGVDSKVMHSFIILYDL
jgi:hypothetical protein